MAEDTPNPYDRFELATAILLGLAAIGAAIAGQQAGQWGGRQLDAFAEANALTTKASTQYNEDMVMLNADYAAVAIAKQHILEARDAARGVDYERHLEIASYFYTSQLSEPAYKAMGLPGGYWEEEEVAAGATPPSQAEPVAEESEAAEEDTSGAEDAESEEEAPADVLEREIPDDDLFASLQVELDEDYVDAMLSTGEEMFEQADARFAEGRVANNNGDQFDLASVFFAIALFFAGLGLVFKTQLKWVLLGMGAALFVFNVIFMMTMSWAL